jgi:hypothetical protein
MRVVCIPALECTLQVHSMVLSVPAQRSMCDVLDLETVKHHRSGTYAVNSLSVWNAEFALYSITDPHRRYLRRATTWLPTPDRLVQTTHCVRALSIARSTS